MADDFQDGVCCDSTASNCRQDETSICSFDLARSWYTQSHYFVCPFEESVCGPSHTIEPSAVETEAEITNLGQEKSANFIFGEVCSYQVKWPEGSVEGDTMKLGLSELEGSLTLYAAHGTGFELKEKL